MIALNFKKTLRLCVKNNLTKKLCALATLREINLEEIEN
jgi:hypothetical protein